MNRRPSQSLQNDSLRECRYRTTPAHAFSPTAYRKRRPFSFFLRLTGAALLLLLLCNSVLNRFVLVRQVSIPVAHLPAALDGYTLLHISDLKGAEFGACQTGIVSGLQGERIDAVVLTGDMVSPQGNAQPLYDLLDALSEALPNTPVWFIAGDGDPEPVSVRYASDGSCYAPWVLGASRHGARILRAPVCLKEGDASMWLVPGADLSLDLAPEEERFRLLQRDALASRDEIQGELARYHLARLSEFRKAHKEIHPEDLCVALLHAGDPGSAEQALSPAGAETLGVDAVLSGHWLGGLFRIPGVGPLFIPSVQLPNGGLLPGEGYDGLFRAGTVWQYVSPGLGPGDAKYPAFFFRFANPPSISLVRFFSSGV